MREQGNQGNGGRRFRYQGKPREREQPRIEMQLKGVRSLERLRDRIAEGFADQRALRSHNAALAAELTRLGVEVDEAEHTLSSLPEYLDARIEAGLSALDHFIADEEKVQPPEEPTS